MVNQKVRRKDANLIEVNDPLSLALYFVFL